MKKETKIMNTMKKVFPVLSVFMASSLGLLAASTNEVYTATADSVVGAAADLAGDIVTRFGPIVVIGLVVAAIFAVYRLVKRALSSTGGR